MHDLGIDQMSIEDRLGLVGDIWDSIADEIARRPLTENQRREVERRLAEHEQNPDAAIPWEKVRADTLARLRHSAPPP